jgi:hypothetical protein
MLLVAQLKPYVSFKAPLVKGSVLSAEDLLSSGSK